MKKVLICLSLFLLPNAAFSCPVLEGEWRSSKDKFTEFNTQWANIESKAWHFMSQTQGLEIIKYQSDGKMIISTPEFELKMGEKVFKKEATEEKLNFQILGCDLNSVVLKYERSGKEQISHIQFENDNTYWEYMGKPGRSGNGHIREYYSKIK